MRGWGVRVAPVAWDSNPLSVGTTRTLASCNHAERNLSTGWWRAGVVLGIGIARARARTARHSTGYHSIDDAHAPLCMSNSLHAAHSTGLAAILGGLQYYKYAQVTRDKSARLSSPMRLRLHR